MDTYRKRRTPPAWDPPKLLLVVVSGLHVVVGTSRVVVVVINGDVWLLDSNVWSQQSGIGKGKRGSKATVSTHPKYSQDLHQILTKYASVSKENGLYLWTKLQNARI